MAYSSARTTFPSDSFPGMVAQVTGGSPKTTGVYYDDSYNRVLLAPGTKACATARYTYIGALAQPRSRREK